MREGEREQGAEKESEGKKKKKRLERGMYDLRSSVEKERKKKKRGIK